MTGIGGGKHHLAMNMITFSRSLLAPFERRRTLPVALACVLGALAATAQRTPASSGLVLNGVTVVNTHDGSLKPNQTVVIDGGKIVLITGSGLGKGQRRDAQVVDARGKYLVPGFWDMHAHVVDDADAGDEAMMMLANGVTGFRQMSGSDELLARRKAGTLLPPGEGAEVLAMPGTLLLRPTAPTPEAAVALVDKEKGEGADFIKTVDVSVPVFFAALAEANKQGLPYAGHLSTGVDAVKASEAGMRAMEHLGPGPTILISCSTAEPMIRQAMAAHPPPASALSMPPEQMAQMSKMATANPILMQVLAAPDSLSRYSGILQTYDEARCRKVAQVFVDHNTWQVPTLIRVRTMEFGDDPVYSSDPNLKYVSPATRQLWAKIGAQFTAKVTPADKQQLSGLMEAQYKLVKLFDETGVKMLAGSDFGGQWLVPGFSLHQEFDQLAHAGVSPLKVLQMTTLNGAQFFGREATAGSVESGKDANLVLLGANPLESVANLHQVDGVVRAGKYYPKDALEAMKSKVAARMASKSAQTMPAEKAVP